MSGDISGLEGISTYPGFGQESSALRAEIEYLRKELQELRDEFESYQEWAATEEAQYRKSIATRLGDKAPQPKQRDRGEILRALINASGGKMFAKDARQKMGLSKSQFSDLLKSHEDIVSKPFHLDKRRDVLTLK